MQEKISLQELIALNNTQQAKNLIKKYGYRPARNYDDLIQKLYRFTKENREEALKELANFRSRFNDYFLLVAAFVRVI